MPKTNVPFWQKKFDENVVRDQKNLNDLASRGWDALVVWQCEAENANHLAEKITTFLGDA
jgi:DNA mismatch endonuclease (patch repair protein)